MTETVKYGDHAATSGIDKVLLRGAASGLSPQELSASTNGIITPAKAAQRVRDILASRDWLTQVERKQLLLDDLAALKDVLYEKAVTFRQLDASGPLIKVLTTLQKAISEDKIDLQEALTKIKRAHAEIMLAGISIALERSLLELEKRYPDVPKGELIEIFQIAMPEAVRQIESKVDE